MKHHAPTTHETFCLANADHFTAVRGRRPRQIKTTHASIDEARAEAARYDDGRTMIYAVTAAGHAAHIENA